jgi:hypothetical protein
MNKQINEQSNKQMGKQTKCKMKMENWNGKWK